MVLTADDAGTQDEGKGANNDVLCSSMSDSFNLTRFFCTGWHGCGTMSAGQGMPDSGGKTSDCLPLFWGTHGMHGFKAGTGA